MLYHTEIEARFGITEVEIKSPNINQTVVWNPTGLGKRGVQLTWLVTDGKHIASGYDGKNEETIERLKTAVSELRHTVTDAKWTVVCEYTKRGDEADRRVILYTEQTCWKKLYDELEEFLEQQEYARFEDIIDKFLIE